jgi:hypothetical protein
MNSPSAINLSRSTRRYFINQHDKDIIMQFEQEYGKYLYVPLDIPNIKTQDPEFTDWWFKKCKPSKKIIKDLYIDDTIGTPVYSINATLIKNSLWSQNYIPFFMIKYKDMVDQIKEYFPFKTLKTFYMWSSTESIGLHRDVDPNFADMPLLFRSMLHDENSEQTMYISESDNINCEALYSYNLNDITGQKLHIDQPPQTNSFVLNNLRCRHGSIYNNKRKIIAILHGDIDWIKYKILLERSITKYKDSCITSNNPQNMFL